MSTDLLFPILPREGKVPVITQDRVKKISAEQKSQALGDAEREEHDEERLVTRKEQYRRHDDGSASSGGQQKEETRSTQKRAAKAAQSTVEEDKQPATGKIKHLDIYI